MPIKGNIGPAMMKTLTLLICLFLLFSCSNSKKAYWCGDHACINKKEKEAYFKKTMIVEIRELSKKNRKSKSELEIIKKQAGLKQKKEIKNEKDLAKQARLDEKRKIKEEKNLAKQARLDEKRRIKEEKNLAKQARLDEKRRIKEEKDLAKQVQLEEKETSKNKVLKIENKEIVTSGNIASVNNSSGEFEGLLEKIIKKNMFRSYPNINDIPN